ncbi:MAG TPA: cytochrome c [Myxococcota bacterium]|jgi:mono/diheme cytochrome c family protein
MRTRLRRLALGAALAGLACSDSAPPPTAASAPAPAAAPAPAPAPAAEAPSAPDAARGKLQFESYCVSCHGPRGEGDGPVAASLDPKPARLGDRAYMSGKTDDYLFGVIKNGGASVGRSPMMAPWGGSLSDAQIRDVIAYVRSLAH